MARVGQVFFIFKFTWRIYGYIPLNMKINEFCNCGMLRRTSSHITALYNKALKGTGLQITQFALLKYISLLKVTNLNGLKTVLPQDRSTLGRNIRVIEKLKLIKTTVGKDKREIKIEITSFGAEILENTYIAWKNIDKKIASKLGEVKQEQLREIMNEINKIKSI